MKTTLYVQDIECDSCVRLVERTLKSLQGINQYTLGKESVTLDFDPSLIREESIIEAITSRGYKTSTSPLARMSYKARWQDFLSNKRKYAVERRMLLITFLSLSLLFIIELLLYLAVFRSEPGFLGRYGQWFLYLNVSVVLSAAALWHLKAYKGTMTSMTGMMLGMTLGMQGGFMLGAVTGATNGMFTGSVVGTLAGVFLGTYAGMDSGIMGALQGMMSGLMGGTMGAMLTVMLLADRLALFMPLFMLINAVILWAMSYMVFEEMVEEKRIRVAPMDFLTFFSYVFVATAVIGAIMLYGPKSLLVAFA